MKTDLNEILRDLLILEWLSVYIWVLGQIFNVMKQARPSLIC